MQNKAAAAAVAYDADIATGQASEPAARGNGDAEKYFVKLPAVEKATYLIGGFGTDLIFATVMMFLTFFYTDIYGITPTQVAMLFLVARVWDAINDPIMGAICEKCNFRRGKYRSWILYMTVPYGLSAILCFTTPESQAMKLAYAWVTYILFGMLFTAVIIPFTSLSSSMTQDPLERTYLNSYRMLGSQLGSVGAAVLVPYLSIRLGSSIAQGYQYTMVILAVMFMITFLLTYYVCQERVPASSEPFHFKEIVEQFRKNTPLVLMFCLYVGVYSFSMIFGAMGTYYVTYNVGRPDLLGTFSVLNTLPSVIPLVLVPPMVRKIGKKNVVFTGCTISIIGSASIFFFPYHAIVPIFTAKAVASFGYGILMGILWSTIPDTVEYGEYVTGRRSGGVIYAMASFAIKVAMTIAGVVPTLILDYVGYVPNAEQSARALAGINILTSIVPAACLLIAMIIFTRYNLTPDVFHDIVKKIAERKAAAEQGGRA